ncbi:hypothetical protein AK830_g4079 [Neonectria ditissima]|uniref:protein S-acyltransferase n=1 Tax=Neonectria ditissima TaxID=78410 RepID=A0A0P7B9Y6_9HYPO|nr:hypothetical protein AK830_g4079 [Neonectria ditissima]
MSDPQGILDWINALPDSFAHPASQTKPTKAPPTVNKRKLQEPSPPRTILNMAETSSPKRQRMLDPENDPQLTPRARHETATCPSRASSASASQTSSLSRSSSPLKRQIMRLHLDNTGLELRQLKVEAPPNPQAGELLETLLDISRGLEFLPDDRRAEILGSPALRGKPGREWRFAFKSASELGNLPGRMPSPEEVALVYEWASVCHDIGNEEAGWNEEVHHRLLEAVFREPGTTKGGLLNFTSCTTARPHKNWLPKCTGAKMVDYCIYLDPNQEGARSLEAHQKLCGRSLTLSVNHTEFQRLRLRPIVLSIETKGPAQGLDVAEVQMLNLPLEIAINRGSPDSAVALLDAGASSDSVQSSLYRAALQKDVSLIRALLSRSPPICDLDEALQYAASAGNVESCQLLLDVGANNDYSDSNRNTALQIAAYGGNLDVVELLASGSSNMVEYLLSNAKTPTPTADDLLAAVSGRGRNADVVRLLLQYGADPNRVGAKDRIPIHHAAQSTNLDVVRALLDHSSHPKGTVTDINKTGGDTWSAL